MAERVGFYLSTTAILLRFKHMPTNLSYYNVLRYVSRDSRCCMRCCWKPIRHCFRYHWYHSPDSCRRSNGCKSSFCQCAFLSLVFAYIYPLTTLQLSEISICDIPWHTEP